MDVKKKVEKDIMRRVVLCSIKWNRYLQRSLNPFNITLKQQYVLRHLEIREFLYPSEIAEMLYADRPTTTVIISNMLRKGWVTKMQDPKNLKMKRIVITPEGRTHIEKIRECKALWNRFDPLACFNQMEKKTLKILLERLESHLDANIC